MTSITIGNIVYTLDTTGTFYKVTGKTPGLTDILIQDYINGIPVQEINEQTFGDYKPPGNGPYTLSIPTTVKIIRSLAFNNLGGLFQPNPVVYTGSIDFSNMLIIEDDAFSVANIIMSDLNLSSANSIGTSAFKNCADLNGTLTLSPLLTTIDLNIFGSTNLSIFSPLISTNLITIVTNPFDSIPDITEYNFYYCTSLSSIDPIAFGPAPSFVIDVYVSQFTYDHIELSAFPANVRISVPIILLYDTSSGEAILTGSNPSYTIENIEIPETYLTYEVTGIADNAFYQSFTISGTLSLPPSLTFIGNSAFQGTALTGYLSLPASITSIGKSAFLGCGFSGALTLPPLLEVLEEGVFDRCSFTSLAPPTNLRSIGAYAFYDNPLFVYDFTQCEQLFFIDSTAFNSSGRYDFLDINVYVTAFTYERIKNFPFPKYVKLHTGVPVSNICFVAGTMVKTDQGKLPIQSLTRKNTLRGQPIQVTKTKHDDPYLVKIQAYAFDNVPTQDTYMSLNHRVYFNRVGVKARDLVNGETVTLVDYTGEPLYNVLVKAHTHMEVHGMIVETLDPTSVIALLYTSKLSPNQKTFLVEKMNRQTEYEDLVIHLKRNQ